MRGPFVEAVMGVQASWATSVRWEGVCKSMWEECAGEEQMGSGSVKGMQCVSRRTTGATESGLEAESV